MQKIFKKLISLILVIAMTLSLCQFSYAAEGGVNDDIVANTEITNDIDENAENGEDSESNNLEEVLSEDIVENPLDITENTETDGLPLEKDTSNIEVEGRSEETQNDLSFALYSNENVEYVLEDFYEYRFSWGNMYVFLKEPFKEALINEESYADSNGTVWEYGTPLPNPGSVYNDSPISHYNSMFEDMKTTSLDLSTWDMSNAINLSSMFMNSEISNLNLSNWNTENVESLNGIFYNFINYSIIGMENWNTSSVTDMGSLVGCSEFSWDISNWDTSNVKFADYMFENVGDIPNYIEKLDFSNLTSMRYMFAHSSGEYVLPYINMSILNYDGLDSVFYRHDFSNNRYIDIRHWDFQDYTGEIGYMMWATTKYDTLIVNPISYEILSEWKQNNESDNTEYAKLVVIPDSNDFYAYRYNGNLTVSLTPEFKSALNSNSDYIINNRTVWKFKDPLPFDNSFTYQSVYLENLFNGVKTESIADFSLWDFSKINFSNFLRGATFSKIENMSLTNVDSLSNIFFGFAGNIEFDGADFSSVVSLARAFSGIVGNVTLKNLDLSHVSDAQSMFASSTIENLTIQNCKTSSLEDLSYMFSSSNITNLNISFDTSNVKNLRSMFYDFKSTTPTLDLSWMDTSSVTDMSNMFYTWAPQSLESINLSSFDTSNVIDMSSMFWAQNKLKTLDLTSFNTEKVTNMASMFGGVAMAYAKNPEVEIYIDVSSFNTSNVTNMSKMFLDVPAPIIGLNFDFSNVVNAASMFYGISKNLDLSNCNLDKILQLKPSGFVGTHGAPISGYAPTQALCDFLNTYDKGDVVFSVKPHIPDFYEINEDADGIYQVSLTENFKEKLLANEEFAGSNGFIWYPESPLPNPISDTSEKTYSFTGMFKGISLNSLDLSEWNTHKVSSMEGMFENSNINNLGISLWDVSNVLSFKDMFKGFNIDLSQEAVEKTPLDLSSWQTSKTVNCSDMFTGARLPTVIHISKFDISGNYKMFEDIEHDNVLHIVYVKDSNVANGLLSAHPQIKNYIFFVEPDINDYYNYFIITGEPEKVRVGLKDGVKSAITGETSFSDSKGNTWTNTMPLPNPMSIVEFNGKTYEVVGYNSVFRDIASGNIDLRLWDTSKITTMYAMFYNCKANIVGLENLNTSNVTDMQFMLSNVESDKDFDLTSWDLSKVANAANMFLNSKIKSVNLSNTDMSSITTIQNMFKKIQGTEVNLNNVDLSAATTLENMFRESQIDKVNLDNISISHVEKLDNMFNKAIIAELHMANWDVSNVSSTLSMFSDMTTSVLSFDNWSNFSNLTNMSKMFESSNIESANLEDLVFEKVEDMSNLFRKSNFKEIVIPNWNVSGVKNFFKLFESSTATHIDISNWDVSSATNVEGMFQMTKATTIDVGDLSFDNATSFSWILAYSSVKDLNIENWNVSNITSMQCAFLNSAFEYLDLSNWNTSNVTNMSSMFANTSLETLNVSNWDTTNVTTTEEMFNNSTLENIDISSFDTTNISNVKTMFGNIRAPYVFVKTQADVDYLTPNAGQPVLVTFIVNESVAPEIKISLVPDTLWTTENIKLHIIITDDNILSSIVYTTSEKNPIYGSSKSSEFDIELSNEGDYTFNITATDILGNEASKVQAIKIDKSGPSISGFTLDQIDGGICLTINVEDSLSGFKYMKYKLDNQDSYTILNDGINTINILDEYSGNISIIAYDNMLNESEVLFNNIIYDSTAPLIRIDDVPVWSTENLDINVEASDDNGIRSLTYTTNEDVPQVGTIENGKISLVNEGKYILTITAIDNLGNESFIKKNIAIDKTSPIISGSNLVPGTTYTSSVTVVPSVIKGSSNISKTYYKLKDLDWTEYVNSFDVAAPYDGEVSIKAVAESGLETTTQLTDKLTVSKPAPSGGGGSGGGSYIPTYKVVFKIGDNGKVIVDEKVVTSDYITLNKGTDKTIGIVPDKGFEIDKIILNGKEIDNTYSYTFKNVTKKQIIEIIFKECMSSKFDDVDVTAWYHEYIDYIVERNVMQGVAESSFSPEKYVSRAQIVTMLSRLDDADVTSAIPVFYQDVVSTEWYAPYINWASAEGIINGYGNCLFGPNDELTREQFVTILYRYANGKDTDEDWTDVIVDYKEISFWALNAMEWALENEIITPSISNEVYPKNIITRAEAAKILTIFDRLYQIEK